MTKKIVFTSIFILLLFGVQAQVNWQLAREKNGIKVFTALNGTSKFKAIKVEAVMAGKIEKLVNLLTNATSNKEWIYNTKVSYQIKRISHTETLSYTETEVPWPASNRDVPISLSLVHDEKNHSLAVIAKGLPNAIPAKEGIVRIPYFNSWWRVQEDGKGQLAITYFLEADPGGSVPAWINNLFIARGPYETFNKLAMLLKN